MKLDRSTTILVVSIFVSATTTRRMRTWIHSGIEGKATTSHECFRSAIWNDRNITIVREWSQQLYLYMTRLYSINILEVETLSYCTKWKCSHNTSFCISLSFQDLETCIEKRKCWSYGQICYGLDLQVSVAINRESVWEILETAAPEYPIVLSHIMSVRLFCKVIP
jgi:hypothetical protein